MWSIQASVGTTLMLDCDDVSASSRRRHATAVRCSHRHTVLAGQCGLQSPWKLDSLLSGRFLKVSGEESCAACS